MSDRTIEDMTEQARRLVCDARRENRGDPSEFYVTEEEARRLFNEDRTLRFDAAIPSTFYGMRIKILHGLITNT